MMIAEAQECFKNEIIPVWNKWNPPEKVRAMWIKAIEDFEYNEIKDAVFEYVQNYELYNQPKLPRFIVITKNIAMRRLSKLAMSFDEMPEPDYICRNTETGQQIKFYPKTVAMKLTFDPDTIKRKAIGRCRSLKKTYKGNWIPIIPGKGQERKPGDELTGEEAKKEAEMRIMAGPDCAAKRLITSRVEGQIEEEEKNKPRALTFSEQERREMIDRITNVEPLAKVIEEDDELPF